MRMTQYTRFCRRNCLLITLILVVLAVTYLKWGSNTKIVEPIMPPIPKRLNDFLHKSQERLLKDVEMAKRLQRQSHTFNDYLGTAADDGSKLVWIHDGEFHAPLANQTPCVVDVNSLMDKAGKIDLTPLKSNLKHGKYVLHLRVASLAMGKEAIASLTAVEKKIRGPVLISAQVLSGPNTERCRREKRCAYSEPLMVDSLITLMNRNLSTMLGLTWTSFFDPSGVNQGYTWPMVRAMFELYKEMKDEISVVFIIKASLARASILQLHWLCEVTRTNLILEAELSDNKNAYLPGDIALYYKLFPKSRVFLRLPNKLRKSTVKAMSNEIPSDWKTAIEEVLYNDQSWEVERANDKKFFIRSPYSLLIYPSKAHPAYIGTVTSYVLQPRVVFTLSGRVVFFEDEEKVQDGKFNSGMKIFIASTSENKEESGTQVLIGSSGYLSLSSYSTKHDLIMSDHKLNTVNPCYQFLIEAETRGLDVTLNSPRDCNFPLRQTYKESIRLRLDVTLSTAPFKVYLQSVGDSPTLVDQFKVKK